MKRVRGVLSYLLHLGRPALKLERSPERLLVPMIMAILAILAILAGVLPLKISASGAYAARGVEGHLVVHLAQGSTPDDTFEGQLQALVSRLEENENIASVSLATGPDLEGTLRVLFGAVEAEDQLYGGIVRLDIKERQGHDANVENLQFAVSEFSSANVDDFRIWKEASAQRTRQALYGGMFILVLTSVLVAAILNLTIRLGLRSHQRTLRVLHQLGATDGFAAMLFQATTFRRTFLGAFAGGTLALGLLYSLALILQTQGYVGAAAIGPGQITCLILIPLLQVALAVFIARQTALRILKQTY